MQNGNTRLEATSFYKFSHLQTNSTAFENTPIFPDFENFTPRPLLTLRPP